MKTAAVICELNPFHNGHTRIFRELRQKHGADRIVAIMSGNYVQRGEPAVFDKYVRTRMALTGSGNTDGGYADLVLELPLVFATSSAHEFAAAGIRLAAATGIIDMLGFGIEAPASLTSLSELAVRMDEASVSSAESDPAAVRLRELLASGLTYPAALSEAFGIVGLTPNNILAVEYLRALHALEYEADPDGRRSARITPLSVIRNGDSYSASEVSDTKYTSATALRTGILGIAAEMRSGGSASQDTFTYSAVPEILHPLYRELIKGDCALHPDALSLLLESRILAAAHGRSISNIPLSSYLDVSREIADRLMRRADRPMTFTERIEDTKTRQYTYSRISRALLHIALGITCDQAKKAKSQGYVNHIRILGFRREAADLMHELQRLTKVPVITKPADHKELLEESIFPDQIYYAAQAAGRKYVTDDKGPVRSEYGRTPVII